MHKNFQLLIHNLSKTFFFNIFYKITTHLIAKTIQFKTPNFVENSQNLKNEKNIKNFQLFIKNFSTKFFKNIFFQNQNAFNSKNYSIQDSKLCTKLIQI